MTTDSNQEQTKNIFRDINADDDDPEVTQIESLCLNCHEQGMTRLFLTGIPFFREVIVSSFGCDQCGYKNSELQPAGQIQEKEMVGFEASNGYEIAPRECLDEENFNETMQEILEKVCKIYEDLLGAAKAKASDDPPALGLSYQDYGGRK